MQDFDEFDVALLINGVETTVALCVFQVNQKVDRAARRVKV
jgi:hypothetical protein